MKKLSHFLFLMFSFFLFGIGLQEAKAVQCNDLAFASGSSSGTIVEIGGVYYYSVTIANSGSPFISDVDITIATTEFTVGNLSNQSIDAGTVTLNFPITSDVSTITTGTGFAVVTTLTFDSGTPAPCDLGGSPMFIYTHNWGCTNPSALNYDPGATFDNNSCLEHICDLLSIANIEVVYTPAGEVALEVTIVNNSSYTLGTTTLAGLNITSSTPLIDVYPTQKILNIAPGGFKVLMFEINSPLQNLFGTTLLINGNITVNAPDIPDLCQIDLSNYPIDISHLGCTDATAFNYDQYAVIDNGICISDIVVDAIVTQPTCQSNPVGSVMFNISGGTPSYTYDFSSFDINNLYPGTYIFTVADNTDTIFGGPIVKTIYVTIEEPPVFEVSLTLVANTILQASLTASSNASLNPYYYWLLDGTVIDSTYTHEYPYTTPGIYTCYRETEVDANGQKCWDYSNGLLLTQIGTDEYENEGLSVYPNPNYGTFTIYIDEYSSSEIYTQIFDMHGKEVYRYTNDNFYGQLHFESLDLQSGLYQVRIENGDQLYRAKVVIE